MKIYITVILGTLFICSACTPYEFVNKKDPPARETLEKSSSVVVDSSSTKNQPQYRTKFNLLRGVIFGTVGFFAVPFITLAMFERQALDSDCRYDCVPPYLPWVAGAGLTSGFVLGAVHKEKITEKKSKKDSTREVQR